MVGLVPAGFSFLRTEPSALDISYVFDSVADLEEYLSSSSYLTPPNYTGLGNPYTGQVVAVLNGTAQPDVHVVWEVPSGTAGATENQLNGLFFAHAPIAGGGAAMPEPPADDQLYGRTRATGASTGAWEIVADDGTY